MEAPLIDSKITVSMPNDLPEKARKYAYIDEDPYSSANCISHMFYYWAYRIIKLANITQIKNEYLGRLKGKYTSKNYLANIKNVWEQKRYKYRHRLALIQAGFRSNLKYLICVIIFSLLRSAFNIAIINFFRLYMQMFQSDAKAPTFPIIGTLNHWQVAAIYLALRIIEILVMRQCFEYQSILGNKSSVEFNCLIFEKLLKVSPSSMKDRARSGEIMNFMQVDARKLQMLMHMSPDLLTIPMMIVAYSYMLFKFFGIAFIFGFVTMFLFFFLNFYFHRKFKKIQKEQMKLKDKRMKIVTETFNNLKVLKLYAWEDEYLNRINSAREDEINNLEKRFKTQNLSQTIGWFAPVATSVASIGAYQYFNDTLRIEDIFTSLGIFAAIQGPIRMLPMIFNNFYETSISMRRIEKYLNEEEINERNIILNDKETKARGVMIKVENGDFSWGAPVKENDVYSDIEGKAKKKEKQIKETPSNYGPVELSTNISTSSDDEPPSRYSNISSASSSRIKKEIDNLGPILEEKNPARTILKNINLEINKGEFVCIIGEVGSGKSSLLQAMLNNMLPTSGKSRVILNGSVSYVSQSAWIQNATVKNNILFYQPYDDERYKKVIELSELKPDLEILVGGDLTEIGEKGINLSGGQKARISLARALYSEKDIYIFDDPISALDAHVGMNVMKNCIIGYLKNKTRILVTHALQYVSYADRIVYMKDGEIHWIGTYNEIKRQDFFIEFYDKMKRKNSGDATRKNSGDSKDKSKSDKHNNEEEAIKTDGKVKRITKDEEKEEGRGSLYVYKAYINYIGGYCVILLFFVILIIMNSFKGSSDIWLGYWSDHQSKGSNWNYFMVYAGLGFTGCLFNFFKVTLLSKTSIRTSRLLHKQMIESLIKAPISTFHETIPKGQIFNRLSKEVNNMDIFCSRAFIELITCLSSFITAIVVCSFYQPYCLVFLPFLSIAGYKIAVFYVNCSREISRLEGINRTPVLNLLNETIPGTITIRAYNYQRRYMEMFHERIDEHLKIKFIQNGISQWFNQMLDSLSLSFVAFLVIFTIFYKDQFTAKAIGILLTYCINIQMNLVHGLHMTTSFENSMVSLERCLKYTKCPSERPKVTAIDSVLESWPSEGKIKFENYCVKYRPDTEIVLKNISFETMAHEKIGIVGRTGSGKSTISLCLFRLLEPLSGKITIDGVDITTIGLMKLRSSLTIIPQDPALMEGTLRYNIDPMNQHSNSDIVNVMKKINFDYIISEHPDGINQVIAEGGSNLSVGEKQLICITRAILRKSKIVIMDEATASIDYKTEEIIQKAVNEIMENSTVITIAHRIKTILNCDRVITLDNGEIIDFDSPKKLLDRKKGLFYELYNKSSL